MGVFVGGDGCKGAELERINDSERTGEGERIKRIGNKEVLKWK